MFTTRRDFLKASLGTSALCSLGPAVPAFLGRSTMAAPPRPDDGHTILVVVQMAGGSKRRRGPPRPSTRRCRWPGR